MYILREERASIIIMPIFVSLCGLLFLMGSMVHVVRAILIANIGDSVNRVLFILLGLLFSFIMSFIASAMGCKIP